jgi:hypothetical protein
LPFVTAIVVGVLVAVISGALPTCTRHDLETVAGQRVVSAAAEEETEKQKKTESEFRHAGECMSLRRDS